MEGAGTSWRCLGASPTLTKTSNMHSSADAHLKRFFSFGLKLYFLDRGSNFDGVINF
jgi:hypothetical protein